MPVLKDITTTHDMSPDPRIRVFRVLFKATGEYEAMEVDAYVITSDRYVVVCDTLLCPEDMAIVMGELGYELQGRQLLVINSHADWDHAWGNSYFMRELKAPIIAHENCRTRMLSKEAQAKVTAYQQSYTIFDNVVLTPPTITFSQKLTIFGGDLTFELFPAPGHHADHIALWIPEIRLLFAFDAIEKPFPLIENAMSMFATLENMIALQPHHVLCSHSKTANLDTVRENLAYLHEIERRSRLFLATKHFNKGELTNASELINYSFEEAIAAMSEPIDYEFYACAHNDNIRAMIDELTNQE